MAFLSDLMYLNSLFEWTLHNKLFFTVLLTVNDIINLLLYYHSFTFILLSIQSQE